MMRLIRTRRPITSRAFKMRREMKGLTMNQLGVIAKRPANTVVGRQRQKIAKNMFSECMHTNLSGWDREERLRASNEQRQFKY